MTSTLRQELWLSFYLSRTLKVNVLPGGERRLAARAVKGACFSRLLERSVVLPEGHPILSRELIYTALTRHQDRVVVMHQGQRTVLKDFAAPQRSETARRRTNLLQACRMLEFPQTKGSVFFKKG